MKTKICEGPGCGGKITEQSTHAWETGICATCAAKADQAAEFQRTHETIGLLLPPMWRVLYTRAVAEGFTEAEALELVKVYILSQCPYGVHK